MKVTLYNTDIKDVIKEVIQHAISDKAIKSKKDIGRIIIHADATRACGIRVSITDLKDNRVFSRLY